MAYPILLSTERRLPKPTSKHKSTYGIYQCACLNTFESIVDNVKRGLTTSCGCARKGINATHGLSDHPLYVTWAGMIARTNNPKNQKYKYYGGRGIIVCDRWMSVENFIADMYPTYIAGLTLDRIENDGNYEPGNCRWSTQSTQTKNTRRIYAHNTSGYRGVYWDKRRSHWVTQIRVNDKHIYLGSSDSAIGAAKLYDAYVSLHALEHTRNF